MVPLTVATPLVRVPLRVPTSWVLVLKNVPANGAVLEIVRSITCWLAGDPTVVTIPVNVALNIAGVNAWKVAVTDFTALMVTWQVEFVVTQPPAKPMNAEPAAGA